MDASAQDKQSLAVVTTKNFVSGLVGGGCEAVAGYPLETVKARLQTQRSNATRVYTGTWDCLRSSIRDDGLLSLYRGASPQLFRSAVSASILFGLMGQYRYFYNTYVFDNKPTLGLIGAGMSTGFTEGFLYTPFEVVKVRMQTQFGKGISNWDCVRDIRKHSGLRGLYRGLGPTAGREMVGNTAYFMAYETPKELLLRAFVDNRQLTPEQELTRSYAAIATAGGCAGFVYWLAIYPIDTVKSVMQADRLDKPRYSSVFDCTRQVYREGGLGRFYRGISSSLIRAFPANAITFVAFETTLSFLNKLF